MDFSLDTNSAVLHYSYVLMKAFTGMAEPSLSWSGAQMSLRHTPVRVRRIWSWLLHALASLRYGHVMLGPTQNSTVARLTTLVLPQENCKE